MNISNFTLTKETKEKMNRPLNNRDKGRLRKEKLEELAKSGKLAFIKNRADLAEAVGFTYEQRHKAGYQWVNYNLLKGALKEKLTGYTDNGLAEYEYEYVGDKPKVKTTKPDMSAKEPVVKVQPVIWTDEAVKMPDSIKPMTITITKGDLTIRIEHADKGVVEDIVKSIKE